MIRAWLKRRLFGAGHRPRKIHAGLLRGLHFPIDPNGRAQLLVGLHETEILAAFREFAGTSASLVDIGSDLGWYVLAMRKVNPAARIRAFEPTPDSEASFLEVLKSNGMAAGPWLDWQQAAVGTQGVSLDRAVADLPRPLLLKVDIEEFETDAVASGRNWIDQVDAIVWETHSEAFAGQLQATLERAGWQVRRVARAWWRALLSDGRAASNAWLLAKRP